MKVLSYVPIYPVNRNENPDQPTNKYPPLMAVWLHLARHCQGWGEVLLSVLVKDKGIEILAKEWDTNPGAFEVFNGLMFKTFLPQDEGSDTI